MSLEKITTQQMDAKGVCAAPDVLSGTPAQNKAVFDRMVRELIAPAYNAAVDAVNALEETESGIEAAEALRVAAEELRAAAETARAEAESGRAEAEQQRQDAETQRQDLETGYVARSENGAKASESWAVGGTGTREGEDTNNAKYWSEQAAAAAGGGVTSFKGRTGYVIPASGDYTAEMVGAYSKEETDTLLQNKAPAGFGLGEDATIPEDRSVNNITANGFYYCDKDTPNSNDWMILHIQRSDVHAVQFGRTYNQSSGWPIITRVRNANISNAWQPWEWVNPPMTLGVEYRTTERYLGKPVYVKVVNAGKLPNASVKGVSYQTNGVVDDVISCTGCVPDGDGLKVTFPGGHFSSAPGTNDGLVYVYAASNGYFYIMTHTNITSWGDAYVTVKYTKIAE